MWYFVQVLFGAVMRQLRALIQFSMMASACLFLLFIGTTVKAEEAASAPSAETELTPKEAADLQYAKNTLLIRASFMGDVEAARQALQNGAELNFRDSHGRTAMDYALYYGYQQLFLFLYQAGASTITDAPLYPQDPAFQQQYWMKGIQARQMERKVVVEAAQLNHAAGVGGAWPLYQAAPLPERIPMLTPEAPASPDSETTKEPEPPTAPEPPKTQSACDPLPEDQAATLKKWCEGVQYKVKPACVAAGCGGEFSVFENKIQCTACKNADGENTSSMFVIGGDAKDWNLNSSGQPLAPQDELSGLIHLCGLDGVTAIACEKKTELLNKILGSLNN